MFSFSPRQLAANDHLRLYINGEKLTCLIDWSNPAQHNVPPSIIQASGQMQAISLPASQVQSCSNGLKHSSFLAFAVSPIALSVRNKPSWAKRHVQLQPASPCSFSQNCSTTTNTTATTVTATTRTAKNSSVSPVPVPVLVLGGCLGLLLLDCRCSPPNVTLQNHLEQSEVDVNQALSQVAPTCRQQHAVMLTVCYHKPNRTMAKELSHVSMVLVRRYA